MTDRQSATFDAPATPATVGGVAAVGSGAAAAGGTAAAGALARSGGNEQLVPAVRVRINGVPLPPQIVADLISVSVHEDVDAPGMFTLQLINWDMVRQQVSWADDTTWLDLGAAVEVQMGYVNRQETLLAGEITGLEPEFEAGEVPTLIVRGYDRRHRLMRGQQTRSYLKVKDSDVAGQIATRLGLRAETQDTRVVLDYVLQHNQTDMEFLQGRARPIGYEVVVEDRTLYFRPRQHSKPPTLTLERDEDLIAFFPRLTTMGLAAELAVRGWNPKNKQAFVGKAGPNDQVGMGGTVTGAQRAAGRAFGQAGAASITRPVASQGEADQIARGEFNTMALSYISGSGTCIGPPR